MNATRPAVVLACLALLALPACRVPIAGQPQPAAGFQEPSRHPPRIPLPRRLDGVDPCGLLAPQDLAAVGGANGPPRPGSPFGGTCSHPVGGGPQDRAGAGSHVPFAEAVARQPRGVAVDVEGYSAWLYCELIDGHQTCASVTAVRPDRSLLTLLSKRGASAADTADALFGLTSSALRKLPPG